MPSSSRCVFQIPLCRPQRGNSCFRTQNILVSSGYLSIVIAQATMRSTSRNPSLGDGVHTRSGTASNGPFKADDGRFRQSHGLPRVSSVVVSPLESADELAPNQNTESSLATMASLSQSSETDCTTTHHRRRACLSKMGTPVNPNRLLNSRSTISQIR